MITDALSHPPPTTGTHAYNTFRGPAKGASFTDPVFGEKITRLTADPSSASDIYAKNGFWNADGKRLAHNTPNGLTIIDTALGGAISDNVPGNFDGSFDPVDPHTWYYFDGRKLMAYSIKPETLGEIRVVKQFTASLGPLGGSVDWISRDGRYMVLNIGGQGRVWDKRADALYTGAIPVDSSGGWLAMSPDGRYVVTTFGARLDSGQPITSYALSHVTKSVAPKGVMFWSLDGDHGDLASVGGKTFYVTKEAHSEAALYAVDVSLPQDGATKSGLAAQRASNRKLIDLAWQDIDGHISCAGEWAFVSVESTDDDFGEGVSNWRPYKQEIVMANVITGEVRRLAHHRSRGIGGSYYYQPRVCAFWDASRVAWASNFGSDAEDYGDIYTITVGAAVPVPPPPVPVDPPPVEPPLLADTDTIRVVIGGQMRVFKLVP